MQKMQKHNVFQQYLGQNWFILIAETALFILVPEKNLLRTN